MAQVIRMPRLSDTMEEGVIVEWLKKEGDQLEPGDILAEVETDKATMELENYHEGVLLYIGVKEGPVPVNGVLAVIGDEGEDYQEALKEAEAETESSPTTSNGVENGTNISEEQVPPPIRHFPQIRQFQWLQLLLKKGLRLLHLQEKWLVTRGLIYNRL